MNIYKKRLFLGVLSVAHSLALVMFHDSAFLSIPMGSPFFRGAYQGLALTMFFGGAFTMFCCLIGLIPPRKSDIKLAKKEELQRKQQSKAIQGASK